MFERAEQDAVSTAPRFPIVRGDPQGEWKFNEEIGLFLTRRCPLRCAHCIVSSHPAYDDPDEESVLRIVRSIAADGRLKHISITGGEPFLRLDLLAKCVSRLRAAGKRLSVVTSAHWAATAPRAEQVLEQAFGGARDVKVWLSLDPHHSEFLPARNYHNAIDAAYALGIEVGIKAVFTKDPEEGTQFVQETIPPECLAKVKEIYLQPLFVLGRAQGLEQDLRCDSALPEGVCGKCVPHINEDGQAIACCGVFDAKTDNPLYLGDAARDDLGALLDRSDRDWLIQAVRTLGPARMARLIPDDTSERHAEGHYLPHDICSLCDRIMSSPERVRALRARLARDSELRTKIALLRFALYGEHRMLAQKKEEDHAQERFEISHR